jgi:hypothetical protein
MAMDILDLELIPPHANDGVASDPLNFQARRTPDGAMRAAFRIEDHPLSLPAWVDTVDLRPQPAEFVHDKGLKRRQCIGDA